MLLLSATVFTFRFSLPRRDPAPLLPPSIGFHLSQNAVFFFCACKQARNWVWLIPHVPRLHLHVAACLPLPLIMQRGKSNSIKCKGQIQIKRLSRQKLKRCCLHSSNNNKSNGYNNKYNCNNTKRRSKAQTNIRITINTVRQDICSIYRLENIDTNVYTFMLHRWTYRLVAMLILKKVRVSIHCRIYIVACEKYQRLVIYSSI